MSSTLKGLFWFAMLFVLLIGCSEHKDNQRFQASKDQDGVLVYEMDTLKIPIDSQTSYSYFRFNTYDDGDEFFLVIYQRKAHRLNFYSLSERKLSKVVALERGGPNGIGDIQNFYIHTLDSIFIFDEGNMRIIDDDADVSFSMNLFEKAPSELLVSFSDPQAKPVYSPKLKKVLLKNELRRGASKWERDKPILFTIDLKTKSFELIGPEHAEFMKASETGYGPYHGANFTFYDSSMVYNYAVSSSVYRYNFFTNKTFEKSGDVISIPNKAMEFKNAPTQAFINKYRFETPVFYQLMYDPYRELYYRIHRSAKPYNPTIRNVLENTTFYVSVFDRDMNFLKEMTLGKNMYSQFTAFVSPKGLCLSASFKDFPFLEESNMILHVYDFFFE